LYCFPLDSDIGWKTRGLSTIQRYAEKVPIICVGTKEDLMRITSLFFPGENVAEHFLIVFLSFLFLFFFYSKRS